MKLTTRAAFTLLLISTFFCLNQQSDADIVSPSSTTLFSADGGDGTGGNNGDIFDGNAFNTQLNAGYFATNVYLRERSNLAQGNLRVGAVIDFDVSGFTAPVQEAILEFTAYTLNDTTGIDVGQITGTPGFDPAVTNVIAGNNTFPSANDDGTDIANFSIDVTTIVNNWIADPTSNIGFYLGLDNTTNDGVGIYTGGPVNDGSDAGVFTPTAAPDSYKALALHVTAVPEPTSALLLTFGGLALVTRRRR